MKIKWTSRGLSDLARLHEFLAARNAAAAARVVRMLVDAPETLPTNPRLGEQLFEFDGREVRKIIVGRYEMRYEIRDSTIYVLRIWHTRENRRQA